MRQVMEDDVTKDGVEVRHPVKKDGTLYWSVRLACGHKQLARHSDLQAELTIQCIQCQKTIDLKATGNGETTAQFKSWAEFRRIEIAKPRPLLPNINESEVVEAIEAQEEES